MAQREGNYSLSDPACSHRDAEITRVSGIPSSSKITGAAVVSALTSRNLTTRNEVLGLWYILSCPR